jgi:hypothetical protein
LSNLDTSAPIVVPATAAAPQLAAGIRQVALSAGVILGAFGASGLAAKANIVVAVAPEIAALLLIVGPSLWAAAMWLGQLATRKHAQQAATMAAQLPDRVAQVK